MWSNAEQSSQTIRQRAIKDVRDSAVRVKVQPDTLRRVLDQPGAWRLHARLGDRPLVTLPVTVAPPLPEHVRERGLERGRKRGRFPFRLVGLLVSRQGRDHCFVLDEAPAQIRAARSLLASGVQDPTKDRRSPCVGCVSALRGSLYAPLLLSLSA